MSEATPEATPAEPTTAPNAQPSEPTPSEPAAAKSFTQDEVNAILAKQKRENFGDYGDLKAKADELAKIKASQQSEQERAAEAARQAQEDAKAARAESLRYKAAATHGIGQDYFDLLGSGDEETINGRGERLGGLLKQHADLTAENAQLRAEVEALRTGKPVPPSSRPIEALRPGATPTDAQSQEDLDYVALFGANG